MQRIDGPGHIDNTFTEGNPATSTPATIVTADWLNDKQEELCNVVLAAGLTLDGNDQTQLKQAISALAAVGTAIPLKFWQTDPDQNTVLSQDAFDSDGEGQDLLYKYVFPAGLLSIMYTQVLLPFSGYDLQLCFPYRMSSSASGDVYWQVNYRLVSTDEVYTEIANWAGYYATMEFLDNYIHTPSAIVNQRNLVSGSNLVIPASAYSAYDTLQIALFRNGPNASDTHTGNAEVDDSILLVPVLPS